ncbi:MAG: hypothetical protein QM619_05250 [Micropruina sp.]|uniref:hypothetical protein n=1 Tax=Micropruina sp. TaxID=2737536 RepID=UPI0039E4D9EE
MSWFWRPEPARDADEHVTLSVGEAFGSQSEAEAWLGLNFTDLADAGVRAVSLYEEDRLVYGPMSLEAE